MVFLETVRETGNSEVERQGLVIETMLFDLAPRGSLEWIGSTAAVCTTVSFVPQLIRVWRRKSAHDISLTMFLLFSFGVACWLVYGIGIGSRPVIAANAAALVLSVAILVLKVRYDRKTGNSVQ
jgi:MtN3 and saliva related transmembrane protein